MGDNIKICALGGLDENGRDCYVVEINDDIYVLDCGISLPDKSIPGVDFLLPNYEYLVQNKERIKAYIITHGHDENMSALQYFYESAPAPVYCTKGTKMVMEGTKIINKSKTIFNYVTFEGSCTQNISGREFVFFSVAHNAANSVGVAIDTDKGWIVFTSDFIVDYSVKYPEYVFDFKTVAKLNNKGVFLLMTESKKAGVPGYCSPKHRIYSKFEKVFKEDGKRIFINSFWQNYFRIREIVKLCKDYHKKLYYYNEYTRNVMENFFSTSTLKLSPSEIITKENLLRNKKEDMVILMLGHGEELYEEMRALAQGNNEDKRIALDKDDIFINVAIPRPALETLATRCIDSLYRTGCQVIWVKSKELSAMHACQDDLKFFLSLLLPKYYLPVRGSFVNLINNANLAVSMGIGLNHMNVFLMDNGMQLVFEDGKRPQIIPNEVNKINIAPILVDGKGLSKVGEEIIQERQKLSVDGVVVVAATVSLERKEIVSGPDCQMRGFVYVKEAEPLLKSISNIFIDEINTALMMDVKDFEETKLKIQERAKRFIKRENGRDPLIMPLIITVD